MILFVVTVDKNEIKNYWIEEIVSFVFDFNKERKKYGLRIIFKTDLVCPDCEDFVDYIGTNIGFDGKIEKCLIVENNEILFDLHEIIGESKGKLKLIKDKAGNEEIEFINMEDLEQEK